MGRSYAGILGLVAFLSVMIQGFIANAAAEPTLFRAWIGLLVFTAIGYLSGRLAQWMVEDSIRTKVTVELASEESTRTAAARKPGRS